MLVQWLLSISNAVIVACSVCSAYICAVVGWKIQFLSKRVERIEMHALTLHSEILKISESQTDHR